MRFMVLVKASKESETGVLPSAELMMEMGRFNEELVKAGVLLAGEGLHPSSKGMRIRYSGKHGRTVTDGPFAETKELVAGFWMLQVKSREEVLEWMRRAPFQDGEVEIRQVYETEEFAPADPTGEVVAHELGLRAQIDAQNKQR